MRTTQLFADESIGTVIRPGDDGYAEASTTFIATGTPELIVRPGSAEEVAAALARAADAGQTVSVRSGGHSVAGFGTHTDGMVIDLSRLDQIDVVDPAARVVRIGSGARWGAVAEALRPYGWGLTAGDSSTVGVGGLTLGGGVGWMVRKHGLAIDHLVAARVVTADGRVLRASADSHPDLFWALRGGGGNFGVVSSFEFVAQPVTTVDFGTITFEVGELDGVGDLVRRWRDATRGSDESLTTILALMPGLGAPPSAVLTYCYAGDGGAELPETDRDRLRGIGTVLTHRAETTPYAEVLEGDHRPPAGIRAILRNTLVPDLGNDLITDVAAAFADGRTMITLRGLGGALGRVPSAATAFAHRDAEAMIIASRFGPQHIDLDPDGGFARRWAAVAAHGTGLYPNFVDTATAADVAAAYPAETYARLAEVKRRYDPANVFRRNHNIVPA